MPALGTCSSPAVLTGTIKDAKSRIKQVYVPDGDYATRTRETGKEELKAIKNWIEYSLDVSGKIKENLKPNPSFDLGFFFAELTCLLCK
jgi:hypothetical protein